MLTDEAYAVSIKYFNKNYKKLFFHYHLLGSGLTLFTTWLVSTLIGIFFGKNIPQFLNLDFVKEPSDIFNLDYNKIEKLEGWGKLSINNLKKAIQKSQTVTLDRFIYSIGIRHIGQENAKILAGFFGSLLMMATSLALLDFWLLRGSLGP